jgi:hypothetical protein
MTSTEKRSILTGLAVRMELIQLAEMPVGHRLQ